MSSSGFPQKKNKLWLADLSGLQIRGLFFRWETTWTHVLTRNSEKTDFMFNHIISYYLLPDYPLLYYTLASGIAAWGGCMCVGILD